MFVNQSVPNISSVSPSLDLPEIDYRDPLHREKIIERVKTIACRYKRSLITDQTLVSIKYAVLKDLEHLQFLYQIPVEVGPISVDVVRREFGGIRIQLSHNLMDWLEWSGDVK